MVTETRSETVLVDTSHSRAARLRPVSIGNVALKDLFWAPRAQTNRTVTLPSQYQHCEDTGRIDNFRRASGKKDVPFQGIYFNDSDVYKWLEAVAWALASEPDPDLQRMANDVITEIVDAQQPNGYLNTYFMFDKEPERWSDLRNRHELYCAGHLFQAAVAHYRATGGERLLDVARRFADRICDVFGPEEEGKRPGAPGHEEIEMALVELYRATGEPRYLRQARYFIDARGNGIIGGSPYHQDHKPFREMDRMVGHAVRAVYLNAGAADVYAESGDDSLRDALDRMWENMTTRQMYVSGGIGSRYEGEAFGNDYELPNERAYTESCAAIGSVMWSWRMLMLEGDTRYADLIEHTLYNAILPGLSLDGQSYFYQNPLSDSGSHRRQPWFGCACCPPNIARLLASLPAYFYSTTGEGIWVHLYAEGDAQIQLHNGNSVKISQHTRYPWNGDVRLVIDGEGEFSVFPRIPEWCDQEASITVNGEPIGTTIAPGSYAEIRRTWKPGDTIELVLPMSARTAEAHPYVAENKGRVAILRGPMLYCIEQADNPDVDPRDVVVPDNAVFEAKHRTDLLGGVTVLSFEGYVEPPEAGWSRSLYRSAHPRSEERERHSRRITAIPYYAWANREPGRMQVWLRSG